MASKPIFINNNSRIGVLILHGFSSTPEQLKEAVDFASKNGFNVSVPLIAGHGTRPEDLMETTASDWKKSAEDAYLKLKEISDKIFIVGSSFGSNLAFWLAEEFDNEMAGIISLSAPIFLRYHGFSMFRLYSYGLFVKYYRKPKKTFRLDKSAAKEEVIYEAIPTKSLREFFRFIKKETIPCLSKIKVPVFICQSPKDNLVHPKSAIYIYNHIKSDKKEIYWVDVDSHFLAKDDPPLFDRIINFIENIRKSLA
jgi:carboxylesterase